MEATFIEKHNYTTDINFAAIKGKVQGDLEERYLKNEITNDMIYSAFRKNPEYYLTYFEYLSKDADVIDNLSIIKTIADKFFIFCMKDVKTCYYVMKGGEMLASYNDANMAKYYANRMDGYVIKVE